MTTTNKNVFETFQKACDLFGVQHHPHRAYVKLNKLTGIWGPQMKETFGNWQNSSFANDDFIVEWNKEQSKEAKHYRQVLDKEVLCTRITFANKGAGYEFLGVYKVDVEKSEKIGRIVWARISNQCDYCECVSNSECNIQFVLNDAIVAIVEQCLKGLLLLKEKSNKKRSNALMYLLGQSVRQYMIPNDHWHLSKDAKSLWEEITSSHIEDYFYNENITCDKLQSNKNVNKYKGNSHTAEKITLVPKGTFRFNDLFHCEHVIPVNRIIEKLRNLPLDKIKPTEIESILKEMHICRITKDEDRAIKDPQGREENYNEIIEGTYKDAKIELYF